MSHTFLFDENIYVRPIIQDDGPAERLWMELAQHCHHILASSPLLFNRVLARNSSIPSKKKQARSDTLLGIILSILRNSSKSLWVEPNPDGSLSNHIRDPDDRFLADIAEAVVADPRAQCCIVVTTDAQTREDFNHSTMASLAIRGVSIEDGIQLSIEPP